MRRVVIVTLALALAGCGILWCDEDEERFEIEYEPYGPGTTDLNEARLGLLRDDGYTCTVESYIRNAAGSRLGERWVCTRC